MAVAKNVEKAEKVARIIVGVILIPVSFTLSGFWKPLSGVVGVFLILTALVGY